MVGGILSLPKKTRVIPGTETSTNSTGVYKAKIEVFDPQTGKWLPKTNNGGFSTMFPRGWSEARVMREVEHAFATRRQFVRRSPSGKEMSMWDGITPSGVKVEGYWDPKITVYPVQ